MNDKTKNSSELIRLHRITPDQPITILEIHKDQISQFAQPRPVPASEIHRLIEVLFQQLPESERQSVYMKIRTDDMI